MQRIDRTGESRVMKNGMRATIKAYRNNQDMDVEFENGQTSHNKRYENFKRGEVACPVIFEYIEDYIKVTNPNPHKETSFLVDNDDYPLAKSRLWVCDTYGYASSSNGIKLHRLIMNAKPGEYVDHINEDKSDNRKRNLRLCTYAENCRNIGLRSTNTSGYKGVDWHKGANKWMARITVDRKYIYLGIHSNIKDAARAYNEAAIKYHGEFAKLNIID